MACSQLQKIETKVHLKASAQQFYDVFCNRTHHIANISPKKIHSVQILKGEWGTERSIISWNYTLGMQTSTSKLSLLENNYIKINFKNKNN